VGSSNGSVYEASDTTDGFFTVTAPDLRVINVSVSNNLLQPGGAFTVNATANNQGNGSSNVGTTLRYFRSTDAMIDTGDTPIGTDAIGVLAAGGSSAQSAPSTAPAVGGYFIGACVDAVAGESSTTNQCSTGVPITVTRPDLVITVVDAPASALPGANVAVSNTVRNQGTVPTAVGFRVGLYYSPDATCNTSDTLIGSRAVGALAAGASNAAAATPATIPATAVPGNPRYICAVADDLGQVTETNEANNGATDTINILAPPPTVNLKVNGLDAVYPAAIASTGLVHLTLDMTPGTIPLTHYYAIVVGGTVYWVTPSGLSTTTAPLSTFTPVALSNLVLLDVPSWPPGPAIFVWLMYDGATLIGYDIIQVNVS
jgi:subtilase family serine protease